MNMPWLITAAISIGAIAVVSAVWLIVFILDARRPRHGDERQIDREL